MTKPSELSEAPRRPTEVRIETVHWHGQGRVALIGEIDMSNVGNAEAALLDLASTGMPLTLDLVGLSYLDSQGISMFFRLARRIQLDGGTLTLANPQELVRRVLDLANVADVATIAIEL